ncbi:MAG: DNA repair protein RecN [Acidobacteriota bacterium]
MRIRNFAIVEEISIDFSEGLNLITGETGAGKSIIVDAIEILLGERPSSNVIRTGEHKATVEGVFSIDDLPDVERVLEKSGISITGDLILKREINKAGAGKIFINGGITTTSALKEIGNILVDIHGQHQHQSLLHPANHLAILDHFGENELLKKSVSDLSLQFMACSEEYRKLMEQLLDKNRGTDFLEFQAAEIEKISPLPGEDEKLQKEREILKSVEMLKRFASEAYGTAYENERSIILLIKQIRSNMEKLSAIDPEPSRFLSVLDEARYALEDLSLYLRDYLKKLEHDPARLADVEDRIAEIERLKMKYGGTIEAVLQFRSKAAEELEALNRSDEDLESLRGRIVEIYRAYVEAALRLSRERRADAERFSSRVVEELGDMAMGGSRFSVVIESNPLPESCDFQKLVPAGESGVDRCEFLISLNVGEDLRPLARVASGGELSRIMLAINKVLKKGNGSKTLIFDEVDAGIGAGVASAVAQKLKNISAKNQVICITHLPQIASLADHHLSVLKKVSRGRTNVIVRSLDEKERIKEIARMLAGDKISETSLMHAEEMIEHEKKKTTAAKGRLPGNV